MFCWKFDVIWGGMDVNGAMDERTLMRAVLEFIPFLLSSFAWDISLCVVPFTTVVSHRSFTNIFKVL